MIDEMMSLRALVENRLANQGKVVEMQRNQIGKDARLLVKLGASDR